MAVTAGNLLLLAGSVIAAACALFWPNIEQAYIARAGSHGLHATTAGGQIKGKCPLGYEGAMPSNHPPIRPAYEAATAAAAGAAKPAQFVTYANANIWTADTKASWAVNMTVNLATGDIVSMGYSSGSSSSSLDGRSSSSGSKPRSIDMQGAFLMPGFVDPHVHLIPGGLLLSSINLRDLKGGRHEFAQRVAAAAAAAAGGSNTGGSNGSSGGSSGSNGGGSNGEFSVSDRSSWLIGMGWSESDWGGELPNRAWIDEVRWVVPQKA